MAWKLVFGKILPSWLFLCFVALLLPSLTEVNLGFSAQDTAPFVSWSPILAVIVENAGIVLVLLHNHGQSLPGSPGQVAFSGLAVVVSSMPIFVNLSLCILYQTM